MGSFFPFNVHILPSSGAFGFSGGMSHKKHNCASVVAEILGCQNPKPSYYVDVFSYKIFHDFFSQGVYKSLILFG